MTVKTGSAWAGLFVTLDATGALATPSTGPAGTLYVDGVANGATVTITGSNPYKFAVTLPSLTAGQRVDMYITATISSIATAGVVASAQADTSLLSDVKTDTAAILADTGTDGVLLSAGTGAKQISLSSGAVLLQATQTGVTIPTVTSITNGVTLADDAITAAKFDESTAFPLKSADTGSTAVARAGADSDTLETLSDQLDATALEATLTAIKGAGWTNETLAAIDVLIDAIKAKTDLIPAQPAAIGSAMTLTSAYDKAKDDVLTPLGVVDGIVDAIKAKTDTIPASPAQAGEYTAAIAAIPTTPLLAANYTAPDNASISAIKAKTDTIPASPAVAGEYTASIAAIQADLDNPNQYKADVSGIPDAILAKVVVDTLTLKQVLKVLAAIEIGTTTGGGTASFTYTGKDGTTVQLTGVDEDGNRTAVVVTPGA